MDLEISEKELYQSIPVCFQKGFLNSDLPNLMFYMYFLQLTHIDFDGKKDGVPTAGAGLIGNHYRITINPDFWLDKINLSVVEQRVILLIHECIHIIEQDCYLGEEYDNHALYNIAIDLKANSIIIDAKCERYLPGAGNTQVWNNYKHISKQLTQDLFDGKISMDEFREKHSKIPVRGIHPDDFDDPEINVKNCIEKGTRWIYEKLKQDQQKKNKVFKIKVNIAKDEQSRNNNEDEDEGNIQGEHSPDAFDSEFNSTKSQGSGENKFGDNDDINNDEETDMHDESRDSGKDTEDVEEEYDVEINLGSNDWVNAKQILGEDPTNNSFTDFEDMTEAKKDFCDNQLEHVVSQVLDSMESTGKNIGNIPAGLKRLIDKIKNPPQPIYNWRSIARKSISMFGRRTKVGRTYNKPNLFVDDTPRLKFMPEMYLLIALDTSGSMDQKDIIEVLTELHNIRSVLNASMDLCTMDVSIYNIEEIKDKNDINKFVEKNGLRGGGGTYMEPFIEELNKNPKYTYGIYLTDGYVSESYIKPIKPYMVLLTSSGADIKWGKVPVVKIPKDYFNKPK
jgi:predicted metal-dependent peptidase